MYSVSYLIPFSTQPDQDYGDDDDDDDAHGDDHGGGDDDDSGA